MTSSRVRKSGSAPPGAFRPMALTNRPENAMIELQTTVLSDALRVANKGLANPRPDWRQPDPDIWFTANGEYASLPQCITQQLDPRSGQEKWDDRHQLSFTRINHIAPKGMRSYFDRMVPSVTLRDQTIAYPNVHDRETQYEPHHTAVDAQLAHKSSLRIKDVSDCEKRKTMKITWNNTPYVSTKQNFP